MIVPTGNLQHLPNGREFDGFAGQRHSILMVLLNSELYRESKQTGTSQLMEKTKHNSSASGAHTWPIELSPQVKIEPH